VIVKVMRFIELTDDKGSRTTLTDTVLQSTYPGVPAGTNATRDLPITFRGKSGDLLPSSRSRRVAVSYRFDVECSIAWAPDIEAHLPVTLYQPAPPVWGLAAVQPVASLAPQPMAMPMPPMPMMQPMPVPMPPANVAVVVANPLQQQPGYPPQQQPGYPPQQQPGYPPQGQLGVTMSVGAGPAGAGVVMNAPGMPPGGFNMNVSVGGMPPGYGAAPGYSSPPPPAGGPGAPGGGFDMSMQAGGFPAGGFPPGTTGTMTTTTRETRTENGVTTTNMTAEGRAW
jgi:hypothetical protein